MTSVLICLIFISINAQDVSSLKTWENILQTPELVEYFQGIFNHLGITIKETGESFTIHHTGDSFAFEEGIIKENIDFVVPLELQNIENMVKHAQDGKISANDLLFNFSQFISNKQFLDWSYSLINISPTGLSSGKDSPPSLISFKFQ